MRKKRDRKKIPAVRMAKPAGRPIQLRYTDPATGREVRISTNTYDEAEAEDQREELRAKLTLGLPTVRRHTPVSGESMTWDYFRAQYSDVQLVMLRDSARVAAECRLDVAEKILAPRKLTEVAGPEALHRLQSRLLAGAESRHGRPRSAHTVKSYMAAVLAALNWAKLQGWIPTVPQIRKVEVGKLKSMKGRPITTEEFERMLSKIGVGLMDVPKARRRHQDKPKRKRTPEALAKHRAKREQAAAAVEQSWRHLLRGLWASALRLEEALNLSWDIPNTITPEWRRGSLPVLRIPGDLQKNATEEEIPLLPWLDQLLQETPEEERTGWVFNPKPLAAAAGKGSERPTAEWVGKVISRIGKAAGVVVDPGNSRTGKPAKFASAHDLRRSCAQRLRDANVPPLVIQAIMRHASWEATVRHYAPGDVQESAKALRRYLGTPASEGSKEKPTESMQTVAG